jgi:DNA-binding response OmpR family regulator
MEGDEERVLSSGCDDYISKPIRIKELLRKVNELLEK